MLFYWQCHWLAFWPLSSSDNSIKNDSCKYFMSSPIKMILSNAWWPSINKTKTLCQIDTTNAPFSLMFFVAPRLLRFNAPAWNHFLVHVDNIINVFYVFLQHWFHISCVLHMSTANICWVSITVWDHGMLWLINDYWDIVFLGPSIA